MRTGGRALILVLLQLNSGGEVLRCVAFCTTHIEADARDDDDDVEKRTAMSLRRGLLQ